MPTLLRSIALSLLLIFLVGCKAEAGAPGEITEPPANAMAAQSFTYDAWGRALQHVDDQGFVDYQALVDDPSSLEAFVAALAHLPRETFDGWDEAGQIALWTNAYNALTLYAIVESWPLERQGIKALVHPRGIRWIPGVWDELEWTVMGQKITLNGIEHDTLRKDFVEPRIHAALVCAAMSCPPLRGEPFEGPHLDRQLDEQMRQWLNNPETGLAIDRDDESVRLSKIFDWYGEDFVPTDLPENGYGDHKDKMRASLAAAARYRDDDDRAFLEAGGYDAGYLDYDWSLNEQAAP